MSVTVAGQPALSDDELLRSLRRTVHRWPETGHQEYRTSALVTGVLAGLGLRVLWPASTSVAAVVGPPGRPAVALRAELDAIPCTEETRLPYASERSGLMHACGHDGHVAALLVLARRLIRHPPPAPVLLVFQQAEETHPSGAPRVLAGLGRDLWPAGQAYAIHLWPELPEGTIGLLSGALMAGVTGVDMAIRASPGRTHGTQVDVGASDALGAMWRLCMALERLPNGRRVTEADPVAVHVGSAHAGEAPNRPAENGVVRVTMRWLDQRARDECVKALQDMAADIARAMEVDISVSLDHDIRPLVVNDPSAVAQATRACRDAGVNVVEHPDTPLGVSDDFGHYLKEVPGALLLVGCGSKTQGADLHSPTFNFREQALLPAADVLERLAHGNQSG